MPAKKTRPGPPSPPGLGSKPSAASLQYLLPSYADPIVQHGKRPQSVVLESHTVHRSVETGEGKVRSRRPSKNAFAAADMAPGYRFDVPPPDPRRRLLFVEISTPWQFWEWSGVVPNDSSSDVRIDGSVTWWWLLEPNPFLFSDIAPAFLGAQGQFTFYTLIPPGNVGFDVGWLVDPEDITFAQGTQILQHLLSTEVDGALRLWFTLDFVNPILDGREWVGPGAFNGGAQSIDVVYAYSSPPLPIPDLGGLVFEP